MKSQYITLLFVAVILLIGATPGMADEVIKLRLHHFLPKQALIPQKVMSKWIADVEAASKVQVKIEEYPSMTLGGSPPELYDQAVDGVADIVWTLPGYTPGRFPITELFELPFMMTDAESASRAFWIIGQDTLINGSMSDTHVLALWVHGPGIIHSRKPIEKISDLQGIKLRAPTRITNILFRNFGAETIGMPVPAVPESLAKGVIDATAIPWEITVPLKTSELVKNHTTFPGHSLYTAALMLTMNKDKYNSLPDNLKKAIDDSSGLEFSAFAGKVTQDGDASGLRRTQELGNNIINLSEREIQNWKKASQVTIDQWVEEMGEKGIDGRALIQRAKALMAKN